MEETSAFEKFELQLDSTAKDFVKEIAKWAYFLSIIGFIGIGFLLLIAVLWVRTYILLCTIFHLLEMLH